MCLMCLFEGKDLDICVSLTGRCATIAVAAKNMRISASASNYVFGRLPSARIGANNGAELRQYKLAPATTTSAMTTTTTTSTNTTTQHYSCNKHATCNNLTMTATAGCSFCQAQRAPAPGRRRSGKTPARPRRAAEQMAAGRHVDGTGRGAWNFY